MMKKMNFIAVLAIIATANEIQLSAMSSAKMAAMKIAYAGLKAEQIIKKHPKTAKVVAGITALYIADSIFPETSAKIIFDHIFTPAVSLGYKITLDKAQKNLTAKQIKRLEADLEKVEQIKCLTCLVNKTNAESAKLSKGTFGSADRLINIAITMKCAEKITKEGNSLPITCDTCYPSKDSSTK